METDIVMQGKSEVWQSLPLAVGVPHRPGGSLRAKAPSPSRDRSPNRP